MLAGEDERKSMGDAFMQSVNREGDNSPEKNIGKRAESQGFRLQGYANSSNGRLSLGDQFMEKA